MLKLYDPLDEVIVSSHFSYLHSLPLRYYASEIMEQLGYDFPEQASEALSRAIHACAAMGIPVTENFRQIYRYDGERLSADWKLSSLASYLLIVNADPYNPAVARAQLYRFMRS